MYVCQRVGRASGQIFFVVLAESFFPGAGGGCFRGISTIGGGAFNILGMSAGRRASWVNVFFCASVVRFFSEWGGRGERVSVDRYQKDERGNLLDRFLSRFHR